MYHKGNLDLLSLDRGTKKNQRGFRELFCCPPQVKAKRRCLYWCRGALERAEQRATTVKQVASGGIDGRIFGLGNSGK